MATIFEKLNTKIISIEAHASKILKSVNFYLIQREESLFLIDAGYDSDEHWELLQEVLHTNGLHVRDLTAILLTHHHYDHVGLVHRISEQYDTPVFIHPYGLPKLKRDPEFLYKNFQYFSNLAVKSNSGNLGVKKAKESYERQLNHPRSALDWNVKEIKSDTLFDFQVMDIPGHAPDQLAFYLEDENIVFIGDLLIDHLRSNAFMEPTLDGTELNPLQQHRDSLKKVIQLDPETAFSGHGKVIHEPAKLAERRLAAIDAKANSFLSMIEAGITTVSDMVKQRHPNKYEDMLFTIISDAFTFLHYLEAKGEITKREINGVWHWEKS